jgi:excinuclease UvrABC nuclease subunit
MGVVPMELEGFLNVGQILRSGVYALVHRREVVYVGRSKTMLVRIYSHRNIAADKRRGKNKEFPSWYPIKGIVFDDVWIRPCPTEDLDRVEREMIAKYRPKYNQLLVPKVAMPPEVMALIAKPKVEGFRRRV